MKENLLRPAVFLDRDGILNEDTGFVYKAEDFRWRPSAQMAVKWCNEQGALVIVVTNQSGVARGYYTEEHIQQLHVWVQAELKKVGAHIDAFYYCPHHPEGAPLYNAVCDCRKPAPGMLQAAMERFEIDPHKSFLIGDRPSDVEAAANAGIPGFLYTADKDLLPFVKQCAQEIWQTGESKAGRGYIG